eukprot:COSAG01_NODE_5049_length_4525_cov_11.015590_3_plen_82_part_00
MSLYHCRPTAFTTALTYLATSSSLVFTVRVCMCACVPVWGARQQGKWHWLSASRAENCTPLRGDVVAVVDSRPRGEVGGEG